MYIRIKNLKTNIDRFLFSKYNKLINSLGGIIQ